MSVIEILGQMKTDGCRPLDRASSLAASTRFKPGPQIDKNKLRDDSEKEDGTHQNREASGSMRESPHFLRGLREVRNEGKRIQDQRGEEEGQEDFSKRHLHLHQLFHYSNSWPLPNGLPQA